MNQDIQIGTPDCHLYPDVLLVQPSAIIYIYIYSYNTDHSTTNNSDYDLRLCVDNNVGWFIMFFTEHTALIYNRMSVARTQKNCQNIFDVSVVRVTEIP